MSCSFSTDSTIAVVTNCGGVTSTVLALISLLFNDSIEPSLRAILISYSISNMAGSSMFVFGITTSICLQYEHPLDYIYMMTIVLSLSHLLLLILHYYITLTTTSRKAAVDFSGLIIIAWITSAAIGSMITVSTRHAVGHMLLVVGFIITSSFAVRAYFVILHKHRKRESIQKRYRDTFLCVRDNNDVPVDNVPGAFRLPKEWGRWNLTLLAIMLFTYISCTIPWLASEVVASYMDLHEEGNSVPLILYALNFYIPSSLCVMMGYKSSVMSRQKGNGGTIVMLLEETYRLRSNYVAGPPRPRTVTSSIDRNFKKPVQLISSRPIEN